LNITKLILNSISIITLILLIKVTCAEEISVRDSINVNGGIGEEDASEMRAKAGSYNLRLYMSEGKQGQFIAGAKITISDKKGNVILEEPNSGPMLFVYVANSSYTINAVYKDITITRKVIVSNRRGENVYLIWKSSGEDVDNSVSDELYNEI